MPRRIEIELTSARPDGTWTWRAAGAREPRGVLDGGLLPGEAKPGDVLKAEADFELEGITIVAVLAPKAETRSESERIEVIGPAGAPAPGVTTQLVGRGQRRPGEFRRDREDRDGRPPRRGEGRRRETSRPESDGRPPRQRQDRKVPDEAKAPGEAEGQDEAKTPDQSATQEKRDGRGERDRRERSRERTHDRAAERGQQRAHDRGSDRGRERGGDRGSVRGADRQRPRFNPASTHRRAALEALPPEQQPVAEQLLRGGIPAVRTALHLEREKAVAEGRPAPNSDELIALAESLLPKLRAAEWRDRAEAAVADAENVPLRDLRSVVAGSDLARDEETRALAGTLRDALDQRLGKLRQGWSDDITAQLDAGRIVRALRLSGRPPDPSTRLDADLARRLAETVGAAMSPETSPEQWCSLLEAAAESPVRRSVTPAGLPANATPDLKKEAHQYSGAVPALAKLLGVAIPPPPPPIAARRRQGPAAPRRQRPPGPARHDTPTPEPPADTDARHDTPTPEPPADTDARHDTPTPEPPADTEAQHEAPAPPPPAEPEHDAPAPEPQADALAEETPPNIVS